MKKIGYILLFILIILIFTNPGLKAFKEYLGKTVISDPSKSSNFFVYSIFYNGENKYIGIAENFFYISPSYSSKKSTDIATMDSVKMDSTEIDTVKSNILSLPYKDRVYLALKDNIKDFNISKEEFYIKIKDKKYALETYKLLKINVNFKRTQKEYLDSLNIIN